MNSWLGGVSIVLHHRIVELRKSKKITQEVLADKIGVSRSALSQYELGTRQPDYETIKNIAEFFKVSTDYLLGRTNEQNRVLQPHSRITIDMFLQNKSAEEIYQAFNGQFLVGDLPIPKDEALFIIDYLRTKWAREMKPDPVSKQ